MIGSAKCQPSKTPFGKKLATADYYLATIERLHQKFASTLQGKLYKQELEGFNFAQVYHDRKKLSKILAKEVSAGHYGFSPAKLGSVVVDGKRRPIFIYSLMDRIVHGAVFAMLVEDMHSFVPKDVYSYVKGKGRHDAVNGFMDYVRAHRQRYRSPKSRGFFVYRSDIKSYGESIPVAPDSPLWSLLDELFLKAYGVPPTAMQKKLLHDLIHPIMLDEGGGEYMLLRGIPDGAPISALLLNLYVLSLDQYLAGINGGFYARFGDDFLFAHERLIPFTEATQHIVVLLERLKLRGNAKKTHAVFFNGAGRDKDDMPGATQVEYLGMRLQFSGTASLKREKIEKMMRDLNARLRGSVSIMRNELSIELGKTLCTVINNALEPRHSLAHPYAEFLRFVVNDRDQLKQIDYRIARLILKHLTGDPSVKKFRVVSYRTMRQDWKLTSLVHNRNAL